MTRLFSLVAYYYAVYINNHIMSNDENVRPTLMVRKVQVMNQHIIVKRSNIFGHVGISSYCWNFDAGTIPFVTVIYA